MDRDGVRHDRRPAPTGDQATRRGRRYWDLDADGYVSDDERDEDADGLTNYDEVARPDDRRLVGGCYPNEGEYPITYAGTKAYDADSDGDGILDGADDQDFDDVPNIMELSRNMAGNAPIQAAATPRGTLRLRRPRRKTCVNPFNPCLPDRTRAPARATRMIGARLRAVHADLEPLVLN